MRDIETSLVSASFPTVTRGVESFVLTTYCIFLCSLLETNWSRLTMTACNHWLLQANIYSVVHVIIASRNGI